jgi:hypothetical protein
MSKSKILMSAISAKSSNGDNAAMNPSISADSSSIASSYVFPTASATSVDSHQSDPVPAEVTARRNLYLKGLQRLNSNIVEIIEDIPHVALYRYYPSSVQANKWVRMEIEGSAFITRNTSLSPRYSFIIMNKKGDNDLILAICEQIEKVKLQEQYLMLKCKKNSLFDDGEEREEEEDDMEEESKIYGIWIHDDSVRVKAKEQLDR